MNGVDIFSQMSLMLSQLQAVSMPNVGGSAGGNQQSFESMMSDKRAESDTSSTTAQKPSNGQNTQTKPTTDQGKTEDVTTTQPEQPLSDEELELRMALLGGMNPCSIPVQNMVPTEVHAKEDGFVEVCATGQQHVAEAGQAGQSTQVVDSKEQQQEMAAMASEQPHKQAASLETVETTNSLEQQGIQTADETQKQTDNQQNDSTQKDNSGTADVQVTSGSAKAPEQKTEQTMIKVGDGDTLDATEPEFDTKLAKQIETALDKGQQKVTIQLTPEHLGKITIEMSKNDNGLLNVVLRTENEQTAHLLREQTSALSNLLQHGGQDEVRVQVAQPQEAETQWKQPDQEQNGHNQQSRQQKGKQDETEQFLQQLRLGLLTQSEEE